MKRNTTLAGSENKGEPVLLNREQLAEKLGVTSRTLASWDTQGKVPAVRIGRTVRYHLDDVLDWLRRASPSR